MTHRGNIQPQLDLEEHTSISGVAGKKVFIMDTSGNVVNIDEDLALNVQTDSVDSNVQYIGKAPLGSATSAAVWQIAKVDSTTGTIKTWADGDANFDNIFDNRESLSYS
jgi:hypothetical protein